VECEGGKGQECDSQGAERVLGGKAAPEHKATAMFRKGDVKEREK
jgi:hypothetical protein